MRWGKCILVIAMAFSLLAACSPSGYPLAEPGKYAVGKQTMQFEDSARENRPVNITLWYPARSSSRSAALQAAENAEPDRSGAPYPLLLSSTKVARILAPRLVSRGFTWASVDDIDTYMMMCGEMIDQPLDILFALNQVSSSPPPGLEGMIDSDHAGAIGYSFDGYNALAMSGARIDPAYYLAQCPQPDAVTAAILGGMSAFSCAPSLDWAAFVEDAGEKITTSEDGLWQPLTDERIRAVMPLAGEGWWLFGERGLAAVDRPVLILVSSDDELYRENVLIFEHLGAVDKALITFVGQDHMMIYNDAMVERMAHFAAAFFGYHLQGKANLARYYAREIVIKEEDLAWGLPDRK